ncbi:MAG: NAD-binding protein [Tepidisphaeraceae bacterium]|jgi:voltage-gated potassium channel Kch
MAGTTGTTATLIRPPGIPVRRRLLTTLLYFRAMLVEFRGTLFALVAIVVFGALLLMLTPQDWLGAPRPGPAKALYAAWMSLLAQSPYSSPDVWYLMVMNALFPVAGGIVIGEGVIRLAMLLVSWRHGEKEWMRVMAATYHDHVVLCGIGHLGYRVLEQLVVAKIPVVAIERDENGRFVPQAREFGIPVLLRDMREDQALVDAGIATARVVIIATNDDMANLEVALDSRRMNPAIRIIMRLFDQQIASKIAGALTIDAAFSASALAAPMVAAMALDTRILSTDMIAGIPHVSAEIRIGDRSEMIGHDIAWLERELPVRALARTSTDGTVQSPPASGTMLGSGDTLVIHARSSEISTIVARVRGA